MSAESFHGTSLRQNKNTLRPEKKPSFNCFDFFLPSEVVCTYDKRNKYAKKFSFRSVLILTVRTLTFCFNFFKECHIFDRLSINSCQKWSQNATYKK